MKADTPPCSECYFLELKKGCAHRHPDPTYTCFEKKRKPSKALVRTRKRLEKKLERQFEEITPLQEERKRLELARMEIARIKHNGDEKARAYAIEVQLGNQKQLPLKE
jgi:hypothetical protein